MFEVCSLYDNLARRAAMGCSALAGKNTSRRSGDFSQQMRKNTPALRVHQLRANKL